METGPLRFRIAESADVPTVVAILGEATRWLRERNIPTGWPLPYPAENLHRHVAERELYLVERDSSGAVATVTLQWTDVPFWGERPPDSCYLHHFAVRRTVAGQGIGVQVLAWAEELARGRGRTFLRLDCMAADSKLVRYYAAHGFDHVGEKVVGGLRCALLVKSLVPGGPAGSGARRTRSRGRDARMLM
jgi:GNAT superfamily N-acetyltransferase